MSAEKERIRKNLEYINNSFIEENQRNEFLGGRESSGDRLSELLLDYDTFIEKFGLDKIESLTLANVRIQKRPIGSVGVASQWIKADEYYSGNAVGNTFLNKDFTYQFDIQSFNFTNALTGTLQSVNLVKRMLNGQAIPSLMNILDLLNAIRTTYNLLEPATWRRFTQLQDVTRTTPLGESISLYSLSDTNTYQPLNKHGLLEDQVLKILNDISTGALEGLSKNADTIRRIMLGYESMIHIYLAAYMYEKNNTLTSHKHFLETTIRHFNVLNSNFYNDSIDDGIRAIYKQLDQRVQTYRTSKATLTEINEKLDDVKDGIQAEKNFIVSHTDFYNKSLTLFYAFMIIFIIALIYLIIGTMRGNQRMTSSIVFAISVAAIVLFYVMTRYVMMEPFNDAIPLISLYTTLSVETVYDNYINNTVNIIQTIDTYRTYGDVSKSINKENHYYSNLHTQLYNDKEKLNSVQMNYYREGKILRYRTVLFLQILAVISLFMIANNNSAFVYVPAAFVVLILIYLYMFNVNNLVRTDSRKYYWTQPDMS